MKKNKFNILLRKKNIRNIIFKNRCISSPISINMSEEGMVTKNIINFFTNLAKSGVAMVTVGATAVSNQGNDTTKGMMAGNKKFKEGLKLLSRSIQKNNCLASIQLYHVGSQANPKHNNCEPVGPSTYLFEKINSRSRELGVEEIKKIEDDFVKAILQCYDSNYDFIEIHLAHGYLLHQFLSPYFNKRTDEYGGKYINRFRIINNILNKSLKANPNLMGKIGFRISANDYVKKGMNLSKTKKLVKSLEPFKPAYIVVTAGIYETAELKYKDMKNGKYWLYAKEIKKITNIPIVAQGGVTDLYLANKLLNEKVSDFIGFAQSLIADPNMIKKTINNKEKEIVPCVAHIKVGSCHRCRYLKQKDNTFSCITPTSWKPSYDIVSKKNVAKDLKIWKKLNNEVYKNF